MLHTTDNFVGAIENSIVKKINEVIDLVWSSYTAAEYAAFAEDAIDTWTNAAYEIQGMEKILDTFGIELTFGISEEMLDMVAEKNIDSTVLEKYLQGDMSFWGDVWDIEY